FNEMAAKWSEIQLPDIPRQNDEFLADLSDKLFSPNPPSQLQLQGERFTRADAVDWLKYHNARILYPILIRLYAGPGSTSGTDQPPVRAKVAFGRVNYDGQTAAVEFKVVDVWIRTAWTPEVGAKKAMETLARWRKDKFVKKAFVALCINFEGYGRNMWAR